MEFRLLGPLEVVGDGGRTLPIGAGRQRALLALLILRANELVTSDRLVDELWGDAAPATAHQMLHNQVSALRRALGRNGRLETRGSAYRLNVGAGERDLDRFDELVERGRSRMAVDPEGAAVALRRALELWRGAALSDVAYEPFAQAEIARLEERRMAAFEARVDAELALGAHADLVPELEAAVAREPLRERLHGQLMLALYRSGRQADALEAYHRARSTLVNEIGVEPGADLRALQAAILAHDPALRLLSEELPPALEDGSPVLAGRAAELAVLRDRLDELAAGRGGVVLVSGPPGIGKTRLAAELAREALRRRIAVYYAGARDPPDEALASVRRAAGSERAALLIVDDADDASPALLSGAVALRRDASLVLALHRGSDPPPPFAPVPARRLVLPPLDEDAVAEIARIYTAADPLPLAALIAESEGIPLAVHRAAAEWARAEAAELLVTSAGRAAQGRAHLRTAEADVAGKVIEIEAVRERGRRFAPRGGAPPAVCPFRGLATFHAAHADYFFGRERLVAELVARLVGSPLLAVVGPSGSGKSSAVRAGLLPALANGVLPGSDRWPQAVMRPGADPEAELERLSPQLDGDRAVLAVDQFEEAFTICRDDGLRVRFLDALVAFAHDPDPRVVVVLALRADFYGHCAAHAELARLIGANQVLVGPMRPGELRRAIELPARRAGLRVEPALTDALVADVLDEPGGLPLLSAALVELWRLRDGHTMRRAAYDRTGGVRGAVGRLAEQTYERLGEPERRAARRILLRLTDAGEQAFVRRRVQLDELGELDAATAAALSRLTESRLVTADRGTVEVAHEALLREWPRLRSWLEEDAEGRRLHQHLIGAARDWAAAGRDPGELYRGARLAATLDWAAGHEADLNALEREFLAESRAAAEREGERQRRANRRLRGLLAGAGALLALAIAAGVVALHQRGNARSEAIAAEAQRLGARALVEDDLDHALLLARQGVALDDTVQTRGNLLAAVLKSPAAIGVMRGDGDSLLSLDLSPDARTLAFIDNDGTLTFADTRTRRAVGPAYAHPRQDSVADTILRLDHVRYSPDGSRLALGWERPVILDARSHRVLARLRIGPDQSAYALRFAPGGGVLFALVGVVPGGGTSIGRFDARSGRPLGRQRVVTRRAGWQTLMLTSDGRHVVTTSFESGATVVRDARTLDALRRWPVGAERAALSRDDRTMLVGGRDGSVRFLDLVTGRVRTAFGRHEGPVVQAAFTAGGERAITAGEEGRVIVWDVARASAGETLEGHGGRITGLGISHDGATLYTGARDGNVLVWDLAGDRRLGRPFRLGPGNPQEGARYALSSDGRVLAAGHGDGTVTLIDAKTLARLRRFRVVASAPVKGMGFVPGGRLLVVGGGDGSLALVDAGRGEIVKRLRGHRGGVFTPGISADGRLMATASFDNTIRLWALPSGRPVGRVLRYPVVGDVSLSPDGRTLAATRTPGGSAPTGIEIFDVPSLRRIASLTEDESVYELARFTPDGRLLVGGSWKGWARLWATESWRPVSRRFAGHPGPVAWQSVSPDGRTLATSSTDGTIRLWDLRTGQSLGAPLPGLPNRAVVPQFTPDGAHLLAITDAGRAFRWDVRASSWTRHACAVAGRTLTRVEWRDALPERDYAPACAD